MGQGMNTRSDAGNRARDVIAAIGLAIGGAFGMAGTFAHETQVRQLLWTIDGAALVVAFVLLGVRLFRLGYDTVAAGFLVFAIGEGLVASGNAAGLAGSVPSFGGGFSLWSAAFLLISVPRYFPVWTRVTGIVAAGLCAITAGEISWGLPLLPTSAPLPSLAYPFAVITFVGWIWWLVARKIEDAGE